VVFDVLSLVGEVSTRFSMIHSFPSGSPILDIVRIDKLRLTSLPLFDLNHLAGKPTDHSPYTKPYNEIYQVH
jgi:hypothetical protein